MAKKKENKTDITVIIPVHNITEETGKSFANAVKSVSEQFVRPDALMIVAPAKSETLNWLKDFDYGEIKDIVTIVENDGETDFASQMNFGVSKIKTTWFGLLEYDDEFSKIWIKNVVEYKDCYDDIDMYLPMIVDVDENGAFIGLTNEAVWAQDFSEEMGVLDNTALLAYNNFNLDGMVVKKETYEELGGLKPSMELTFIYEFLLRLTHFSTRIMVVPRFGYKHVNLREGGLFHDYRNTLKPDEARWWMSLAKQEYFHTEDRKITYNKES
jgi:hypothetical protein